MSVIPGSPGSVFAGCVYERKQRDLVGIQMSVITRTFEDLLGRFGT